MGQAGFGAEEQATRRARRLAEQRAHHERAEAVDEALVRRAREDVRRWSAGAEGERAVAETLGHLGRYGWTVLHDLHWPGRRHANLDHVAVGPGGVVVVDAKNWSGDVRVVSGVLRQNGYAQTAKVAGAADAAAAVTALLDPEHRTAVRGLVCLAAQDTEPVLAEGGATVVGRWRLPEHLLGLPVRLSPYEVADVARFLDQRLGARAPEGRVRSASKPRGRPGPGRAPSGRPPRPGRGARRSARAVLGGLLLRLVLLAGAVALGVHLLPAALGDLAETAVPAAPDPATVAPGPAGTP